MEKQRYVLENVLSFEPRDIFECGQCFRWNLDENTGNYVGVFGENVLTVKKEKNNIIFEGICNRRHKVCLRRLF